MVGYRLASSRAKINPSVKDSNLAEFVDVIWISFNSVREADSHATP